MPDKLIRVEFLDAATQKVFGFNDSPPDLLPETFTLITKVSIEDQEWQLLKAEPVTRAEYTQSGKLTLTLAKIVAASPKDMLYSLPTVYDPLPARNPAVTVPDNAFLLHADLWRASEFVPEREWPVIEREFEAVAIIYADHSIGLGFNKLHTRTKPAAPLAGLLRLMELRALLQGAEVYEAIAFHGEPGIATDVFALGYGRWVLYGDLNGTAVQSLALASRDAGASLPYDPLLQLMQVYNLYLVNWLTADAISSLEAAFFLKQSE